MNNIRKSRLFIQTVFICLLFLSCVPNPVEEAKKEMQKEYHAYFDNTIDLIEQYNWVLYIDIQDYWYPEGTTTIEAANDLETPIRGLRQLSKEISAINIDDESLISAKQELLQLLKNKTQEIIRVTQNPYYGFAASFIGLFANDEPAKEEVKLPEEIVDALSRLQSELNSKMDMCDGIARMRENIIKNKDLDKEQFVEINNAILTMVQDSFMNHFQGRDNVLSYFNDQVIHLHDSTQVNNIYESYHAMEGAKRELKKLHLYDEQTAQMYTAFYADADAYCSPVDKATDNIVFVYKGDGFVVDFYTNALDGEGELYWNVYSYQEKDDNLVLVLRKTFLYGKNESSIFLKTPNEERVGCEYTYKALSCGENSYVSIYTSKKGEQYAEVWVKDGLGDNPLRELLLCKEVMDYLISKEWKDK